MTHKLPVGSTAAAPARCSVTPASASHVSRVPFSFTSSFIPSVQTCIVAPATDVEAYSVPGALCVTLLRGQMLEYSEGARVERDGGRGHARKESEGGGQTEAQRQEDEGQRSGRRLRVNTSEG